MNQLIKIMKKLLEKIKNALLKAFGVLLDFLVKNGEVAIKVTNTVKEIINNPAIDWVVALTPTDVDDKVLAEAKKIVPALAVKVGLAMNIVTIAEAEEDEVIAFSTVLAFVSDQLSEDGKAIFYRELSGLIAESLSDGNISGGEAVAIVQLIFKKII
jgi:hypothetical protein